MSQQARRGAKRKLQIKRGGGGGRQGGRGAFLLMQEDKPAFLLSLSEPSTCTHFKTLKPHSQESLSTTVYRGAEL